MVETYQAKYVSLHVRVSNAAARHLYEDTLGFENEKTEAKYYADGEDAFCMRLNLDEIRKQVEGQEGGAAHDDDDGGARENGDGHPDEGEAVGEVGRDPEAGKKDDEAAGRQIKVAVGRQLGVGDLVEKVENKS